MAAEAEAAREARAKVIAAEGEQKASKSFVFHLHLNSHFLSYHFIESLFFVSFSFACSFICSLI